MENTGDTGAEEISEKNEGNDKNQSENNERDMKPPEEHAIMQFPKINACSSILGDEMTTII